MIRMPVVAGAFYPAHPEALRESIVECFKHRIGPGYLPEVRETARGELFGLIVPHAGYIYSGPIAAHSYACLAENGFKWLLILGPNHTGMGGEFAIMSEGAWRTPLGDLQIEEKKAAILKTDSLIEEDYRAHLREHSIEVQLPFVQFLRPETNFVPICVSSMDLSKIKRVGERIGVLLKEDREAVIIASTDLSHYQPHPAAKKLDTLAIEAILNLDSDLLWQRVHTIPITMCGYAPVIILMEACKVVGATEVKLLKYATSGDTGGDYSQVVGYSAISFRRT